MPVSSRPIQPNSLHSKSAAEQALTGLPLLIVSMMLDDPLRTWSGQDLLGASGGQLKEGSTYVTLQRMQVKGLLQSRQEMPAEGSGSSVIKRLYTLTPLAIRLHPSTSTAA